MDGIEGGGWGGRKQNDPNNCSKLGWPHKKCGRAGIMESTEMI